MILAELRVLWKNSQIEESAVRLANAERGKHGANKNKRLKLKNRFNN